MVDRWSLLKHWHWPGKATPLLLPFLLSASAPPQTSSLSRPYSLSQTPIPLPQSFRQYQGPSSIRDFPLTAPDSSTSSASPAQSNSANALPRKLPASQTAPATPSQKESASLPSPPVPSTEQQAKVPLRVAIARDASSLTVATSTVAVVMDAQGTVLGEMAAESGTIAQPTASGINFSPWQASTVVWVKPQADGLVYVDGRWYRGTVQLIQQGQKLLAVNHVDLESYLYSVVGAEMPASWPIEALKAQAIAARSYALVHTVRPASDYYDLGDTPRWQAYNGVQSESNPTHTAVNQTRGILLSYEGGVVESLYASSDDLVIEAHKGYGMSQHGAKDLAGKNLNYQQILGYFYPGTTLAALQLSP